MRAGAPVVAPLRVHGEADARGAHLLYHKPDEILAAAATNRVDLYCAGHTHGGQVALPVYGALVTLSKSGKKYESGLHREGQTWL